ncbi:hypothetical protein PLEOSDRAFT_1101844 [Pleurotus ostreatus PC15]|uniref:Uncharacterized protein n=1 Tax=Pleurotus ostreatus (strain PC15) TaxID=1137138 RepID=A0A067P4S9_PLEO1|nr:hypothetical protein PLEOSDRAFT_1101844 [Pleurotus ostreatus PC15]
MVDRRGSGARANGPATPFDFKGACPKPFTNKAQRPFFEPQGACKGYKAQVMSPISQLAKDRMSDLTSPPSSQSCDEEYARLEGIRADDKRVEKYEERRDAEDADYQPLTQESIDSLFSSQSSDTTTWQLSSSQESYSTTSSSFSCSQETTSSDTTHFSDDEETAVDEHDTEPGGPLTPTNTHYGQFSTPSSQGSEADWVKEGPEYDP